MWLRRRVRRLGLVLGGAKFTIGVSMQGIYLLDFPVRTDGPDDGTGLPLPNVLITVSALNNLN